MGSFSTPLSGLMAAQNQLKTVSNNLANMNTNGYKDRNLTFSSIFAQAGSTNGSGDPMQTGSGVAVSSTVSTFTDGNMNATSIDSNMAISGNGFFLTQSANGSTAYTRAGDFTTNNAGQITTPNGELVMGYPAANGIVNTSGTLQPMQVGLGTPTPAVKSTMIGITANLSSQTVALNGGAAGIVTATSSASAGNTTFTYDFNANGTVNSGTSLAITVGGVVTALPAATAGESLSNYATALNAALKATGITVLASGSQLSISGPTGFSTTGVLEQDSVGTAPSSIVTVYDSLGAFHILTVAYTKTAPNTWNYTVTAPTADLTGGPGNTPVGSGTLNFNGNGALTSMTSVVPINIPSFVNGATATPPQAISGPFGTLPNVTITQNATDSTTSASITDGFASGTLKSFSVQPDGTINGLFTSGKTLALGQVAVASFANTQGLASVGNNNYQPTAASGSAVIGLAGTGGRGAVIGGSVEQSNVDIAAEFAKLIVAQQAYSANAKSITAFNQVSQATLAMIQ